MRRREGIESVHRLLIPLRQSGTVIPSTIATGDADAAPRTVTVASAAPAPCHRYPVLITAPLSDRTSHGSDHLLRRQRPKVDDPLKGGLCGPYE